MAKKKPIGIQQLPQRFATLTIRLVQGPAVVTSVTEEGLKEAIKAIKDGGFYGEDINGDLVFLPVGRIVRVDIDVN